MALGMILSFFFGKPFFSQATPPPPVTTISGIINSYAKVEGLDGHTFEVDNIQGFTVGSKVLVIQMKGAAINGNNNSSFGTINNYSNAGNYEFATVTEIKEGWSGGWDWDCWCYVEHPAEITVNNLSRSYSVTGNIQLVSVPEYEDAAVADKVYPEAWNGEKGGIVVFQVSNTLTLNADIDVTGMGFRGRAPNSNENGGGMNSGTYRSGSSSGFAQKGEGIATNNNNYARGALANGGGGGNTHNAGGGGGGNYTQGGQGGVGFGATDDVGGSGIGGKALEYNSTTNKIFFGGGGGGGQHNDGLSSAGGNGGGIVIIRAKNLVSDCRQTYSIVADGVTAEDTRGNDGAGGGGAGGTIFLDIQNYNVSCNLHISAHGGAGGMVNAPDSHGGGGGGGRGAILFSKPPANNAVIVSNEEGVAGADCTSCTASGEPGGTTCTINCAPLSDWELEGDVITLPIELLSFKGKATEENRNNLEWVTASEINNDFFTIERSKDGKTFTAIAEITGNGTKSTLSHYTYVDDYPPLGSNYYRLKQTDFDGKASTHSIVLINNVFYSSATVKVGPNPFSNTINVEIVTSYKEDVEILILDLNGKIVFKEEFTTEEGRNDFEMLLGAKLQRGCNLISVYTLNFQ